MNYFKSNKISGGCEIVAESLRKARISRKLSLPDAAKKTYINIRYLEMLENGCFENLPEGIYGKNFLKEYADFLDLDTPALLKQITWEFSGKKPEKINNLFSERIHGSFNFLSLPRLVKGAVIISVIIVCAAYLVRSFNGIISPPSLSVTSPETNLVTDNISVDVEGYSDPEAEVTINGLSVLLGPDGYFLKKVNLKNGLNTISITAQKKYSKKNNIIKKILVNSDS